MSIAPDPVVEASDTTAPSPSPIPVRNVAFILISVAIVILLLQLMRSVLIPFVLGGQAHVETRMTCR
jgi:hypothetical protein